MTSRAMQMQNKGAFLRPRVRGQPSETLRAEGTRPARVCLHVDPGNSTGVCSSHRSPLVHQHARHEQDSALGPRQPRR